MPPPPSLAVAGVSKIQFPVPSARVSRFSCGTIAVSSVMRTSPRIRSAASIPTTSRPAINIGSGPAQSALASATLSACIPSVGQKENRTSPPNTTCRPVCFSICWPTSSASFCPGKKASTVMATARVRTRAVRIRRIRRMAEGPFWEYRSWLAHVQGFAPDYNPRRWDQSLRDPNAMAAPPAAHPGTARRCQTPPRPGRPYQRQAGNVIPRAAAPVSVGGPTDHIPRPRRPPP
ncbi:hypothetical protein TRIHO_10440 [Tritonibacter horizontis]|uniref:Uncharacterized protein n=1 Tax=Tritonibacter horizontis TaxID=1768241 RepID=A0A132C0I8_9RHOB|nr:hypothetical protein TRIHO_10440 [Tritonibacter horizontis]